MSQKGYSLGASQLTEGEHNTRKEIAEKLCGM